MKKGKKSTMTLTEGDLEDAKGGIPLGIPYQKPGLSPLNIFVPKGDCSDGGFNMGPDAECDSGKVNIDTRPPPD